MGCTASCKSCEGVAQNYSVDIGAPDEKDPDEVNEENEGEENPAELYKEFFLRGGGVLPKSQEKSVFTSFQTNFNMLHPQNVHDDGKNNHLKSGIHGYFSLVFEYLGYFITLQ